MKKLFYLALAIIVLGSCQKTNPTQTVATTTYPMGINYVTSTYSNFSLSYSIDTQYNTIINKTSKIELTYVPGDSIHFELITNAPLNHKSETIPCYIRNQHVGFWQYVFKTSELEVQVFIHEDGKKYSYVSYHGNDKQQYNTANSMAD